MIFDDCQIRVGPRFAKFGPAQSQLDQTLLSFVLKSHLIVLCCPSVGKSRACVPSFLSSSHVTTSYPQVGKFHQQ